MSLIPYIKLFADTSETVEMLSDAEAGRLLKSLLRYVNDQELILSGNEKFVFGMLKAQIDRDTAGYQEYLDKQRSNGAKGGRPKKTQENPENPSLLEKTQKTQEKEKEEDKEKDEEEDKDKDKKKNRADALNALFDRFWAAYPRHTAKQAALKAFAKLAPDEALLNTMLGAIQRQKKSSQWQGGEQYIPHPATWLNGKRWEDDIVTERQKPAPAARVVSGQDYQQRDYSGKKASMPDWMIQGMKELENVEV